MSAPMFRTSGAEKITGDLRRARVNSSNAKPAFKAAAQVLADAQVRQFKTEGRHYGPRWAALTPEYRDAKRRRHPGAGILVATGRLRREAAPRAAEGFSVYRVDDDSVEVGISAQSVPYAARIHNGGPGRPARKIIGEPTRQDRERIAAILQQHILKGTGHARR